MSVMNCSEKSSSTPRSPVRNLSIPFNLIEEFKAETVSVIVDPIPSILVDSSIAIIVYASTTVVMVSCSKKNMGTSNDIHSLADGSPPA